MTDEEINEAIAKVCGCTVTEKGWWYLEEWGYSTHPPNYCKDRNAMHEALSTLTEKQYEEFCYRLCAGEKWKESELNIQDVKFALKSKPHEQATTFLKTLNLWKQ